MSAPLKWKKLGRVFCPSGEKDWMQSHAAVPIAENVEKNLFKIYFSSRDKQNKSHTGYVLIDLTRPSQIIELSPNPVLAPGKLGEFDDSGAMASWLAFYGGEKFLYYIGWNLGGTVPFRNSIGLAMSDQNAPFERYSNSPIMDRSLVDPHFCASCCVIPGDDLWRMWYLSCTDWQIRQGKPIHKDRIQYAESCDGIHWQRKGIVAIDFAHDQEDTISRPSVIFDQKKWKMWYSFCGIKSYRIGYAESEDGVKWQRLDQQAGIDVSSEGWDSEMIEYPFVFDHEGRRYMLYNGNSYGKTGFGLAVLE